MYCFAVDSSICLCSLQEVSPSDHRQLIWCYNRDIHERIATRQLLLLRTPGDSLLSFVVDVRRRPFMARMVAQRNSRGFQSNLFERERVLDKHILYLLEKFSDPAFFKKKHGYNVHGQMLGKDGKMIVKVSYNVKKNRWNALFSRWSEGLGTFLCVARLVLQ